jgi:zinc D-Ala-D-Ala carboxypeptidase
MSAIDLKEKLSTSFTLEELAGANDPKWRDAQIAGLSTVPATGPRDKTVHARLRDLARIILQPIRDHVGRPIRVNSGYRSPAKNASVPGSSKTSQHMLGEAADIAVPGFTDAQLRGLFDWIAFTSIIPFGQVIFEDKRPNEEGGAWIHVSLGAPYRTKNTRQTLIWTPAGGYQTAVKPK